MYLFIYLFKLLLEKYLDLHLNITMYNTCYRLFDWQITLACALMSMSINMIEVKENAITKTL